MNTLTKIITAIKGIEEKSISLDTQLTPQHFNFMKYVSDMGKSYETLEEFLFRNELYQQADHEILLWNADETNTHRLIHNQFSDYTKDEIASRNGYIHAEGTNFLELDESVMAATVDWRTKGAVTPVKNQAQCGSCWAFSTTGSVEGAMFLKTGTLQSYSEQQLVDCAGGKWHNNGCNGGLMDYAFKYIESNPLVLESEYKYKAKNGKCNKKIVKKDGEGKVASFVDVPHTAAQLKAAIDKAPVSVAIEADQRAFQSYHTGVITKGCGTKLDHGVLAVGYGTLDGSDYFLVKNSWGASWGDEGYVRIGQDNVCGILLSASYPTE